MESVNLEKLKRELLMRYHKDDIIKWSVEIGRKAKRGRYKLLKKYKTN